MPTLRSLPLLFLLLLFLLISPALVAGWEVTWIDKFEGDRVDLSKWTAQTQANYNNEVQCYTDDDTSEIRNYDVSDGTLKIIARKGQVNCSGVDNQLRPWTSGRLNSKDKGEFLYGRIEARIRFLELKGGTWPAFWMLENRINEQPIKGDNDNIPWPNPGAGEIDVWEWYSNNGDRYITNFFNTGRCGAEQRIQYSGGSPDVMEWTTYAIEWDADNIAFFMNDEVVVEHDLSDCSQYEERMFVLLNVAIGGNLGGAIEPTLNTAVMEVDYVAHCEKTDANEWTSCNENTPVIADDDNDGVSNSKDQCPNTPVGVPVNDVGCEIVTEPTIAAPTPTAPNENAISIFSDAYNNISDVEYNPNWGQVTQVENILIEGNRTLKYSNLNYQGIDFAQNMQNVSGMDYLSIDYWTYDANGLDVYAISPGPLENPFSIDVEQQSWQSVKIPLSVFTVPDLERVFQLKITGNGTVFLDNIYFGRDIQQEQNIAPEVSLRAVQLSNETTSVSTSDGVVNVTAIISDQNSEDLHTIEWHVSGLSDYTTNGIELNFNPSNLNSTQVTISAEVTDTGTPTLTTGASIVINITKQASTPQLEQVSNGGGSTTLGWLIALTMMVLFRRLTHQP
ncbi:glycoside hydrolase family 16 protein [Alteromonas facilis]|uniref:glycoside hydrolase family 16 protein n=1 Tax=Alteromonas facilis TaxID=2048004 RepID=UPI000C285B83|nr:glycoside hydrolase family 16 protein [Alteromonas facilis]